MATDKVIRVGIIGQGRSGYDIHAAYIRTDPRFKIVAVADPLADRRAQAEKEFGAAAYGDLKDLLKRDDLDLVINATPSHLHVPVTIEGFKAGQNVLCEKPLARRAADVDKMIAAAKKAKKLFAVFQQSRFAPYFQKIKDLIDAGTFGRVVHVKFITSGYGRRWDWQTLQDCNGGNLLNNGPHPLDQALQIFGDATPDVFCKMDRANTFGDAEDHVMLILSGKGRPTIEVEVSSCCAYQHDAYQVYGTRGGLSGSQTELNWKYFDPKQAPRQKLIRTPLPGRAYCGEQLPWVTGKWTPPAEAANLFHWLSTKFYCTLYETLVKGAPLVVTPQQVRRQIAVIEECHRQNPLSRLRK